MTRMYAGDPTADPATRAATHFGHEENLMGGEEHTVRPDGCRAKPTSTFFWWFATETLGGGRAKVAGLERAGFRRGAGPTMRSSM